MGWAKKSTNLLTNRSSTSSINFSLTTDSEFIRSCTMLSSNYLIVAMLFTDPSSKGLMLYP